MIDGKGGNFKIFPYKCDPGHIIFIFLHYNILLGRKDED